MRADILRRTEKLTSALKGQGADAFVILSDEDINWESLFYMSGFRGTAGALVVFADGEAELILDGRYAVQGREQSPHKVYEQRSGLVSDVAESLKKHGAEEILCESDKTFHGTWEKLSAHGLWRDGGEIMKELRRQKDAGEVEDIKRAASIGARAFLETLDCVKPGMTEKAFEALLNYKINLLGGGAGFDMIVASGPRSVMPHGRASERPMAAGEWVTVDYGARWNGYFCDITRNFSLGTPSAEAAVMHELLHRVHHETAAMLRAGVSGTAVHNRAVDIFAAEEKEQYFTHSLGHGFGLEIHEAPLLSPRRNDILRVGDVVTIEPGLYIPGFGGMRLEDDYLVTEDGAERLTKELNQCFYSI
ncbi:M24 family metallopeptidase [Cloacibacillus sp.]